MTKNDGVKPSTPSSKASKRESAYIDMNQVIRSEKKEVAARTFGAQVDKDLRRDSKQHQFDLTVGIALTLIGVVSFFVGNIFIQRFRYPDLWEWWDTYVHRASVKGVTAPGVDGGINYSMNQVIVARDFQPVQMIMQVGIWKNLSEMSAEFLMHTVNHFQSDPYVSLGGPSTRGKLTAIHWSGGWQQWPRNDGKENVIGDLIGKNGYLCGGLSTDQRTVENRIVANWIATKHGPNTPPLRWNIWYDFFPDPQINATAFLTCPVIAALYSAVGKDGAYADPCSPYAQSESDLMQLFAGGMCFVAKQNQDVHESSGTLFKHFFGDKANPAATSVLKSTCSGDAGQGAMAGMSGMAMFGVALAPMLGPGIALGAVATGALGGGTAGYLGAKGKCMLSVESTTP
jgi:hypothetical protein